MQRLFTVRRLAYVMLPLMCLSLSAVSTAKEVKKPKAQKSVAASAQFGDSIAALVNNKMISMRDVQNQQLFDRLATGQALPAQETLQKMVDNSLMMQDASRTGIKVTDDELSQTIAGIAERNKITVDQLKAQMVKTGVSWETYTNNVLQQMTVSDLQRSVVQSRVNVNDLDIDAFLNQHPTGVLPKEKTVIQPPQPAPEQRVVIERTFIPKAIAFQHIFVYVPDQATPEQLAQARSKADQALAKLRKGVNFATVAREYSSGSEAATGGKLGVRLFEDWPSLFVSVTKNVPDGGTTGVFKAPNGFHILKVLERRGMVNEQKKVVTVQAPKPKAIVQEEAMTPLEQAASQQGPVNIVETHAKHILIRITPVFSDQQARERIVEIAQRIANGESFDVLAKKYSQDASAPLGGDLGWVTADTLDPSFAQAMNALNENQISQPVRSQFGWHLIEVIGRKSENKLQDIRRSVARENLYRIRSTGVLDDWLTQLRAEAYIDNRIDPSTNNKNPSATN